VRRSLASKRDEAAFRAKQQQLEELKRQEDEGEIELYFYDEAGFSLLPTVPYAWQAKGETTLLSSGRSKSLNVLGLLRRNGDFASYVVEGSVDSDTVVAMLDDFVTGLRSSNKAVIVLDNAPTHSSEVFEAKRAQWQEQHVEVCYLSSYSPELNLIEKLWQELKYRWLPFEAYLSFQNLQDSLLKVLAEIGSEFTISFA
jgi:transposase